MATLIDFSWTLSQLPEGLTALSQKSDLINKQQSNLGVLPCLAESEIAEVGLWMEWAGEQIGVEVESVECMLPKVNAMLNRVAPAVIRLGDSEQAVFLLLLKSHAGYSRLLTPDLRVRRCRTERLRDALCQRYEAPIAVEIDRFLTEAHVPEKDSKRVRSLMLEEQLANQRIAGCWLLRLPPSAPFWQQMTEAALPKRIVAILTVFVTLYLLEVGSWGFIGQAALQGRLDFGWLSAWMLLILTLIPLHLLADSLDRFFSLDFGRILKKRLLHGALMLELDYIKQRGAGQLLGQVLESQALESLALNGGFSVLVAMIELVLAVMILANGAVGYTHGLTLLLSILGCLGLCGHYFSRLRLSTQMRLNMTYELVERMVGHRTCLAQEPADRREREQDQRLNEYLGIIEGADRAALPIFGAVSRAWLLVSLFGLAPAFIEGNVASESLAISLGGILLASRALASFTGGLNAIGRAMIAWENVQTFFQGSIAQPSRFYLSRKSSASPVSQSPIINGQQLSYQYPGTANKVLQGLDLKIHHGDRILLQGESGGGKSTLAALLTGLRTPDSGILLLNSLDYYTLGSAWQRLISAAPQFHENHILSGTLAFNLLMGRNWPPSEDELEQARRLCVDLGLGDLLDRMPSGLKQMVGETGWQLSHGERSRIFLARALLQNSQLTILDESFAALDPESLQICLDTTFARAGSLLVIAHP